MHVINGHFGLLIIDALLLVAWIGWYHHHSSVRSRDMQKYMSAVGAIAALCLVLLYQSPLAAWAFLPASWNWLEVVLLGALFAGWCASLPLSVRPVMFPQPVKAHTGRLALTTFLLVGVYLLCRWFQFDSLFAWSILFIVMAGILSLRSWQQFALAAGKLVAFSILILTAGIAFAYFFKGLPVALTLGRIPGSAISVPVILFLAVVGATTPILGRYWFNQPPQMDA